MAEEKVTSAVDVSGHYVNFHILDNGDMEIQLTPEGKEELEEFVDAVRSKDLYDVGDTGIVWKKYYISILADLFEDIFANRDYDWVYPEDIGALTDFPMFGYAVERDDQGNLTDVLDVWWFPNYQVDDPLEQLLNDGKTVFKHE